MGMSATVVPTPELLTLEAWAALPEDEEGELVDGIVVEEEMGSFLHDSVVARLIALFVVWGSGRSVRVAASEARYGVAPRRGRKPDVSVFLPDGRKPPAKGLIRVPPQIAVEVVTPTPRDEKRDRVEKLHEYASFGVRFYWIVDPELRTFEILELGADGDYVIRVSACEGRIDPVPGCPGLVVDIDALWREVDEIIAEGTEPGE
jgi:Uma2 family endonuclease